MQQGTHWAEALTPEVCSQGGRKGKQSLVHVTPRGGLRDSEWQELEGGAQPSTRAGVARPGWPVGPQCLVGWEHSDSPSGFPGDVLRGSQPGRERGQVCQVTPSGTSPSSLTF